MPGFGSSLLFASRCCSSMVLKWVLVFFSQKILGFW
ncbi:hypothetical protein BVRB_8g189060 [Beta vulgaris subsp. vulgaris]|nr:hypothetical protein BVRB_8g189060 [Beta vulgaris subsp. vulgaris]